MPPQLGITLQTHELTLFTTTILLGLLQYRQPNLTVGQAIQMLAEEMAKLKYYLWIS